MTITHADPFVILEGGLVANDPALPVYDLDALISDFIDETAFEEVRVLRDRASAHCTRLAGSFKNEDYEQQIAQLASVVERCDKWLTENTQHDPA